MLVAKICQHCGTQLINKRSHTKTCSSSCRWRMFDTKHSQVVPVKLSFGIHHFAAIKNAAGQRGLTVAEYIISRVTESDARLAMTISC